MIINSAERKWVPASHDVSLLFCRLIINLAERKVELPAFVFEFEKFDEEDKESIQDTIQAATMQMRENDYAAVLKQEGHTNIHLIAIAFKGKEVRMKYEEA